MTIKSDEAGPLTGVVEVDVPDEEEAGDGQEGPRGGRTFCSSLLARFQHG